MSSLLRLSSICSSSGFSVSVYFLEPECGSLSLFPGPVPRDFVTGRPSGTCLFLMIAPLSGLIFFYQGSCFPPPISARFALALPARKGSPYGFTPLVVILKSGFYGLFLALDRDFLRPAVFFFPRQLFPRDHISPILVQTLTLPSNAWWLQNGTKLLFVPPLFRTCLLTNSGSACILYDLPPYLRATRAALVCLPCV